MSGLIDVGDALTQPQWIYRVMRLTGTGQVEVAEVVEARSDDEAFGKARVMTNPHGLDLWQGPRFLASFPPRHD